MRGWATARRVQNGTGRQLLVAVLAPVALLASACGGSSNDTDGESASTTEATDAAVDQIDATTTSSVTETETDETTTDASSADESASADGDADSPSSLIAVDPSVAVPEALGPGLGPAEVKNLLIDIHGPTDDLNAELDRLTDFPDDIPTADGTDLYDFTITTNVRDETNSHRRIEVRFHLPAEADDATVFYESSLVAAGYEFVGSSNEIRDEVTIDALEFEIPGADARAGFGLELAFVEGDFDGTIVTLDHFVNLPEDEWPAAREEMEALRPYNGDTPIPDGGRQHGSVVQSFINSSVFNHHWLSVEERWTFEGVAGEDLAADVFDLIGSSGEYQHSQATEDDPATLLDTARDEDTGFVAYSLARRGEFNGPRVTVWDVFDENDADSALDFNGGSTDLFGSFTSYPLADDDG